MISTDNTYKIPYEIVDIIIDFIDYKKYEHKPLFKNVLSDINDIGTLYNNNNDFNIEPRIAYLCWGAGHPYIQLQ
jgi:hypothetical protein